MRLTATLRHNAGTVNSKTILYLLASLLAIEIVSTFVVMWTASRHGLIFRRHLAGRAMESLDESEREDVLSKVAAEYDLTLYRKIELIVIAFHIPALASWGIATGQSVTPPLYYYAATMAFWLAVSLGVITVISKLGGA